MDWSYPSDQPEMQELYRRAKLGQWNGETYLPWQTSVDPLNPERPLVPKRFLNLDKLADFGVRLSEQGRRSAHGRHRSVDAQSVPSR